MASPSFSGVYQYRPLNEFDEIRLVLLQPGLDDTPISCKLSHTRLSTSPQYEALSYTWGLESDKAASCSSGSEGGVKAQQRSVWRIFLDGREYLVRENLWQALRHIRLKKGEHPMWINAISIDQNNIRERGHQVAQMSKIYSQASIVRVWLGNVVEHVTASTYLFPLFESNSRPDFRKDTEITQHQQSMCSFATIPYWKRLWIIQEIALAKDIVIQCGYVTCTWKALGSTLTSTDLAYYARASEVLKLNETRTSLQCGPTSKTDLLILIDNHRSAQCSEIRDTVFGLHALAKKCCRDAITTDYAEDTYSVSNKILSHHYAQHNNEASSDNCIRLAAILQHRLGAKHSSRPAQFVLQKMPTINFRVTYTTNQILWTSPPLS